MTKSLVGIDIGGTKIATCVMRKDGEVIAQEEVPTKAKEGPKAVISRIKDTVYHVLDQGQVAKDDVEAIGVGMPGPLDIKKGLVKNPPNLPGWIDIPLTKILEEEFQLPVVLENDANAAVLGEKYYGIGKGIENIVYITVSTGIGVGVIVDGKLLKGEVGNGTEAGHTTINFGGPKCGCGNYGCWEAYASGTSLARFARDGIARGENTIIKDLAKDDEVKAEHVFLAAKKGDKFAKELVEDEGFYLGVGLANVVNMFNPKLIVIGGGLTHEWDMFYDNMMDIVKNNSLAANVENLEVVKTSLGPNVGVIGACAVALNANY